KLMEMRRLASLSDLLGRLGELEDALRSGKPPAERKTPQSTPDNGPAKAGARSAASAGAGRGASDYGTARGSERVTDLSLTIIDSASDQPAVAITPSGSLLDQIKSELEKKKRRLLIAALDAACRVELEGDELSIEFMPEARHSRDT